MKLYHGTSEKVARLSMAEGLKTKDSTGSKGNWEHSVDSAGDRVYLSVAYAGYFANCAAENGEKWGIVEIDTDLLDEDYLLPDEDFLEQASRNEVPPDDDDMGHFFDDLRDANELPDGAERMKARTTFYRDNAPLLFAHLWEHSVEHLGNCCHLGDIPPEAITRVAVFDPESNSDIYWSVDPCITLMNYRICSPKYKAITRWLAGYEDIDAKDMTSLFAPDAKITIPDNDNIPEEIRAHIDMKNQLFDARQYWQEVVIPNRAGLEILKQSA